MHGLRRGLNDIIGTTAEWILIIIIVLFFTHNSISEDFISAISNSIILSIVLSTGSEAHSDNHRGGHHCEIIGSEKSAAKGDLYTINKAMNTKF